MQLSLENEAQTLELGALLARAMDRSDPCPVLLYGPLGSGKTTLVRGLVEPLPNGENAEVSSPSFNLVNIYPTDPEVVHLDLYRMESAGCDENIQEALSRAGCLLVVEWSEFLQSEDLPAEFLAVHLQYDQGGRKAVIKGKGTKAAQLIEEVAGLFEDF